MIMVTSTFYEMLIMDQASCRTLGISCLFTSMMQMHPVNHEIKDEEAETEKLNLLLRGQSWNLSLGARNSEVGQS